MVWIHAGSFMWGDSTGRSEDNISLHGQPYRLVDEGVVFISINYRLGVLGFLASYDSNTDTTQGNYGLSDQQLALRWIRNNASTFDGDPNNITIIGSSAGGKSVLTHFAMPSSEKKDYAYIEFDGFKIHFSFGIILNLEKPFIFR